MPVNKTRILRFCQLQPGHLSPSPNLRKRENEEIKSFFGRKQESPTKLISSPIKKTFEHDSISPPLKTHLPIMSISKALLGFSLFLCLSMASPETSDSRESPTAYEMLEKFNFPKGILPIGVKSYVLNEDGHFEVLFDGECKFAVEGGYSLSYGKKITGKVSFGSLKELKGVSVKVLFLWMGINEVSTGNGELDFYVGPLSASFALSNFEESPQCGCGFDCNDLVSDS